MAKQNQTADTQATKKTKQINKPVTEQLSGDMALAEALPGPTALLDRPAIQDQASRLADPRLSTIQRQMLARQIGQTQGNQHLQRVIAAARQNRQTTTPSNGQQSPAKPSVTKPVIQPKLAVNEPDDQYEQEADAVAEAVMRMSAADAPPDDDEQPNAPPSIQTTRLQRSGNDIPNVTPDLETNIDSLRGRGEPLSAEDQTFFESRMGADFSDVRVHTDDTAAQTAQDLNARAYTTGLDIAFNEGEYEPDTEDGRQLLAHELTHVVQQGYSEPASPQLKPETQPTLPLNGSHNGISPSPDGDPTTIQRWDIGDIGDTIGEGAEWLGEQAGDALSMGADAFMAIVARIAPGLAELIRNGPVGMLIETIKTGVQGWLQELLGGIDIGAAVTDLKNEFADVFATIKGVVEGDPAACQALADSIDSIRTMAESFMENPVVQRLKEAFDTTKEVFAEITNFVLAPIFDALMDVAGGVFDGVKAMATTIWEWGSQIRDFLGAAWEWVKEQLGLGGDDEDGIWEWLKTKAAEAWDEIKETLEPVMGPLQVIGGILLVFSPVGPFVIAIRYGPPLVEAIQWLWEHKDDPNIVESAHEEMGDSILPQLLSSLQGFNETAQSAITEFVDQVVELGAGVLELVGGISGVPLLSMAQSLVQTISDHIQEFISWGRETLQQAATDLQELFQKISQALEPYKEVLSSLAVAIVSPVMIPVILAGWAWRALPECYKLPIIDFLLDVVIGILEETPNLPMFGLLWPLLKPGIIGFLQAFRDIDDDDEKIKVTDKIAKIISGASLDFLLGFVKGFLIGIWEGITDPFVLIYSAIELQYKLVNWLTETAARGLGSDDEATTMTGERTDEEPGETSSPTVLHRRDRTGVTEEDAELAEVMQDTADELEDPATQVVDDFMPAVEEFFSGGEGMSLEELADKLSEAWTSIEDTIRDEGQELGEQAIDYLLQDQAEGEIGEGVGWLVGTITFEVVLAILTVGAANATEGILHTLEPLLKILDWTGEALGAAFRALKRAGGFVIDLVEGLGKAVSNAGGSLGRVMDALREIGEILMSKADEMLGLSSRLGDEVAEEVAEEAAEEAAEELVEETVEEVVEESVEEISEEAMEEATEEAVEETAEETAEEASEQSTRNADELEGSPDYIAAKGITKGAEESGIPAFALVEALQLQFSEHTFRAIPIGGHHQIVMRVELDDNYDPHNAATGQQLRDQLSREEFASQAQWKTSSHHGDELEHHAYNRHPSLATNESGMIDPGLYDQRARANLTNPNSEIHQLSGGTYPRYAAFNPETGDFTVFSYQGGGGLSAGTPTIHSYYIPMQRELTTGTPFNSMGIVDFVDIRQ